MLLLKLTLNRPVNSFGNKRVIVALVIAILPSILKVGVIFRLYDMPYSQDRRLNLRVRPEPHVPIRVDVNGRDFVDIFYAIDISIGGIGLQVPHRFEGCQLDLLVDCLLMLPTPFCESVKTQGKVIHISGDRFGVAFHNLSEKAEAAIDEYISYRLKKESWWGWVAHRVGLDGLSIKLLNG